MAKEADTEKQPDILEEVKQHERAIRAKLLAHMLPLLKDKAHEILALKEYTNSLLEELGVEDADVKRLIDWVNSLDRVKLSEADKREIREDARKDVQGKRKEAEKKSSESPFIGYTRTFDNNATTVTTTGSWMNSTPAVMYYAADTSGRSNTINYVASSSTATLGSGSHKLDVKLK